MQHPPRSSIKMEFQKDCFTKIRKTRNKGFPQQADGVLKELTLVRSVSEQAPRY